MASLTEPGKTATRRDPQSSAFSKYGDGWVRKDCADYLTGNVTVLCGGDGLGRKAGGIELTENGTATSGDNICTAFTFVVMTGRETCNPNPAGKQRWRTTLDAQAATRPSLMGGISAEHDVCDCAQTL